MFSGVGHSTGDTEPLAQGSGGHVYEIEPGGWVTLEVRVDLPEVHEVGRGEEAGLGPGGVQDRGSVSLRQDEPELNKIILNLMYEIKKV